MKEGGNLPAGTGRVGREVAASCAAGNLLLHGPSHSLRIVRAGGNIVKLSIVGSRRTSRRFPHIFHRHGAGAVCICVEGGAGHQALFSGPQSRFIKIIGSPIAIIRIAGKCRAGRPRPAVLPQTARRVVAPYGAPLSAILDPAIISVKGFAAVGSGEPFARHKKVKICALLQVALGENVVLLVPLVIFCSTAHRTASA